MRNGFSRMLLALAILGSLFSITACGQPSAPVGLLVNGVRDPLAMDRETTRFTWQSPDHARGEMQTAYEIVLLSRTRAGGPPDLVWWDSGKVQSDQSSSVAYAGKPLPAATRFWWQVRIWDQTGKAGPYGKLAWFDTGLNQDEWAASYVWDGTTNLNNFAYFRKTFLLTNQPALAKVYVMAHNDYLLYCNGTFLGRGPARSDPVHYGQYNAYDITKFLTSGTNVFAAAAHWHGNWNNSGVNAQPAFILEARLDYPDGSATMIGTDDSWKVLAHTGFIETNATDFGGAGGTASRAAIKFDSRLEPHDWQAVNFDDSAWAPATVVDRSDYHLFAQMAPVEREQAELKPISIAQTNGVWWVDFGRCLDGWPKLTLRANRPGDVVRVQYFQMTGERKPAGWDEYICHGGTETWHADFGRHTSFQVFEITGYAGPLKAADVRGIWAYCDADVAGRFHCSSDLVNSIYEMCERTARQNVQEGIISVDAHREQSPWTADSWNIGNVLLYNDRDTTMLDKVVRDYAAEQATNGDFRCCSPANRHLDYDSPTQKNRRIPEWSMYWPMLLWQQYLFSGDETLLREMTPHLTRFLDWLKTFQDPTTKLINPPGWRISDYAGGNLPSGGYNVATAAQYYDDLDIAAQIFSVLGETNQSIDYAQQAAAVKRGINSNLFNGDYYLARTDTNGIFPLASAWALRFNLEPPPAKAKILATIASAGKPNIGGYGGDAFYSGLFNAGGGDFAIQDLVRYQPMLDNNKTCWESFNYGPGLEVNHAWTAYPAYIFLKYICGIQPTSGGFATFDVRPETGGLTFAEGTVPSVKGDIVTRWKKQPGGRFALSVTVPANTRASVFLPKTPAEKVTLGEFGKTLWPPKAGIRDDGVLTVTDEGSSLKCLVGAGDYHFEEMP